MNLSIKLQKLPNNRHFWSSPIPLNIRLNRSYLPTKLQNPPEKQANHRRNAGPKVIQETADGTIVQYPDGKTALIPKGEAIPTSVETQQTGTQQGADVQVENTDVHTDTSAEASTTTVSDTQSVEPSVPVDSQGKPLPLRTNSKGEQVVDEKTLWNNSPEEWCIYNDKRDASDKVMTSDEMLESAVKALDKQLKNLQKQMRKAQETMDMDVLDGLKEEQKRLNDRKARLTAIQASRAEAAKIAEQEAQRVAEEAKKAEDAAKAAEASKTEEVKAAEEVPAEAQTQGTETTEQTDETAQTVEQTEDATVSSQNENKVEDNNTEQTIAETEGEHLTEGQVESLLEQMESQAEIAPEIELTPENWSASFDDNNSIETPIGRVKMGDNQISKFLAKGREKEFGMVAPTLKNPDVIIAERSESKDGNTERLSSYVFVKTFNRGGKKIKYYASITVKKDGMEVSVSSHYVNKTAVMKKLSLNGVIYTREALLSNSSDRHLAESQVEMPDLLPTQENNASSSDKVTESSGKTNTSGEKSEENAAPKNEGQFGLVSDARMEELKKRLKAKLTGQLNSGFDPEVLAIGMEMAAGYIDRGIKSFVDFSQKMIEDFGDIIRPYLKAFYNGAREMPGMEDLAKEMDSHDTVSAFDVNNFDKQTEANEEKQENPQETADSKQEATTETEQKEEDTQEAETATLGTVNADKDTRDNSDIWVVKPTERVSKEEFKELKDKAKANNGYWSSFKKGFLFKTEEDANNFNKIDNGREEQTGEHRGDARSVQVNDERRTNTATAVLEAGSVAREVEALAEDAGRPDERRAAEAVAKVDKAVDKCNDELALLGYYEAEEVGKDFNEAYGYMRNAEKKAVKDANNLAKKLAHDLGIEVKGKARGNIASVGGEITFRLQLADGSTLYSVIYVEPNWDGQYNENGSGDSLGVRNFMCRREIDNEFGFNHFFPANITYNDLLSQLRKKFASVLPEQPTGANILRNAEIVAAKTAKAKESSAKDSKSGENSVHLQNGNDLMGNLFEDLDAAKAQTETADTAPQAETGTEVEQVNQTDNGLQGDDVVRTSGLPSDSSGHERRLTEEYGESGEGAGQDSGRTDEQGVGRSLTEDRDTASRLGHSVEETAETNSAETATDTASTEVQSKPAQKKNTHNNSVGRGVEYAPKTPAERFQANVEAIKLMKRLVEDDKPATKKDMEVLRKYTGWGGLGTFFNNRYSREYRELSFFLTPEELQSAEYSINTAYFTPSAVIDTLWDVAKRLGFKGGNILEGSAGIGNILASMPKSISENSDISAVELDTITGNILKLLYPDANVQIKGFQDANIDNNSVDLAITNVPFGTNISVYDSKEKDLTRKFGSKIHDFCIAKNVRKLREGGIGIFITTSGTLDKSRALRNWIVNEGNADFIGAFRLNNKTFGGTAVTSDIIVIRKRVNGAKSPNAIDVSEVARTRTVGIKGEREWNRKTRSWEEPVTDTALEYNAYFVEHPENMAGDMKFGQEAGDTFRPASTGLYPNEKKPQEKLLEKWAKQLQNTAQDEAASVANAQQQQENETTAGAKEGQLIVNSKGEVCLSQRGKAVPLGVNSNKVKGQTKQQVIQDYNALKTAINNVLDYQSKNTDDKGLKPLLDELNSAYDEFTRKYGSLNKNVAISFLRNDVDFASVAAVEDYKEDVTPDGKKVINVSKADVFNQRVIGVVEAPHPTNVKDGVIVSVNREGKINIAYIAQETGKTEEAVRKEVLSSGLGFIDPASGNLEVRYNYLSGNVREKLEYAREHNTDGQYDENIKALEKVIPADIPAHLIDFTLGSDWIDAKLYTEYAKEKFGLNDNFVPKNIGSVWSINSHAFFGERNEKNRAAGVISEKVGRMVMGHELLLAAMNNVPVTFTKVVKHYDGTTETISDPEATQAAQAKMEDMRADFSEWAKDRMLKDEDLARSTEETYNRLFNAIVPKTIDDEFLPERFVGATSQRTLYPHQKRAVIRGTTEAVLLAHEVGTGKSFTLISTAMELRRLGLAKKPMIVVQNATVGQFVGDAKFLYPNCKVLTVTDADRTKEGRAAFYAKIKYNDWDMIVVPQSVFDMIPDSEERQRAFVQEKIDEKIHTIELAKQAGVDSRAIGAMEKELQSLREEYETGEPAGTKGKKRDAKREAQTKENAAAKAKQQLDRKTDEVANFDEMGIDALLVDEAHAYKHLGFSTQMQRGIKGVDPSYSKRSAGVYLKLQSIFDRVGRRNVVFATGTPISNTAAEIWTFMKYLLHPDVMKENHIYYFDNFVRNFGRIAQATEFTTSGKFKETTRFSGYINLPELVRTWSAVADTVLSKEAKDAQGKDFKEKLPDIEGGKAQDIFLPQSPSLIGIMNFVRRKLEEFDKMSGKDKRDHSSLPLVMYGIAQRAAIDPRLVDRNAADEPLSKTNKAVEEILKDLKQTESYKGTCAVFCDNYRRLDTVNGKKVEGFNLFREMKRKLVENGVPEDQIVIMESGMTVNKKQQIFDKVIDGDIRVIMGSTQTLGTGVNIQTRLHSVIHLDAPNRPMDYTQRNGRILRQGNLHKEWGKTVRIIRFGVEDSLDVTAYQRLKTKSDFIDAVMNGKALLANAMEGRTLEEPDEGLFDNAVAQLSGSQYAMLVSAAEREVRKLNAQKQQHDQDQIYIANKLKENTAKIERYHGYIDEYEKALSTIENTFKGGKVSEVTVEGKTCKTEESIQEALKERITKPIRQYLETMRYKGSFIKETLPFRIDFDGVPVFINVAVSRTDDYIRGELVRKMSTVMTYDCPDMNISNRKVADNAITQMVEDFKKEIASGKNARSSIEVLRSGIAKMESDNSQMSERKGKPFKDEEKLKETRAKLDEYRKLMKEELEAKEKKYADAMASSNSSELESEMNELLEADNNTDEDVEFEIESDEDYRPLEESPERQTAYDSVREMLDNAAVPVEEVSAEELARLAAGKGNSEILRNGDTVYGAAVGGKILLNAERLNPNTPVHEYTHLWDKAVQQKNPELWKRGVELMKQTSVWQEVANDPNYAGLDENGIASEVHSRLAGDKGEVELERMSREVLNGNGGILDKAAKISVIQKLRKWLSEFWYWVKNTLTPWNAEEAERVTIEDFVNMPIADLAKGTRFDIASMETPIHESKGTFKNLAEAENWAKENLQGKSYTNQFTGDEVRISGKSISEMLNPKSTKKISEQVHLAALQSVPDFIKTGIPTEIHKDTHGRGYDVMRLYNAININGEVYRVKSTIKRLNIGDNYYTYEIQEMEIIGGTQSPAVGLDGTDNSRPQTYNSISGAKLLKGVKKTNSDELILPEDNDIRFHIVTDKKEIDRLNSEPTIKVYRAMQLIDGKLYPPMSAKVNGKWRNGIDIKDLGKIWERADENPELADDKGYFKLDKGNKSSVKARYNPYIHTSLTLLNDQFSSAQSRPELVIVEVEIPVSELTSGYKAEKAKDSVGKVEWKAGVVQSQLTGTRTVILSRWDKPVRIVPDSEAADKIVEMFGGKRITMPSNVVTPSLRAELEKRGVPFIETDNQGKPVTQSQQEQAEPVRFREKKSSAEETDAAYNEAVEKGDMAAAQRLVDEQAERMMPDSKVRGKKGKLKKVYHGSDSYYHFDIFSREESRAGFFFTDKKRIAQSYIAYEKQYTGEKPLYSAYLDSRNPFVLDGGGSSWQSLGLKVRLHIEGTDNPIFQEMCGRMNSRGLKLSYGEYSGNEREYGEDDYDRYSILQRLFSSDELKEIEKEVNPLDIWNYIVPELDAEGGVTLSVNTDTVGFIAERSGYDGVIFNNIRDHSDGVYSHNEDDNSNVYVVFQPNQIKSADAVTRNDEGNVIPLSERFNEGSEDIRFRENEDSSENEISAVNSKFNEELERQSKGELEKGHIYQLGKPSAILRSTGVPNLPIELTSQKLAEKSEQRNHTFDILDVAGLPAALQSPMAVFSYGDKGKAQNIIVSLQRDGKQFVVGLHFNQEHNGLLVNSIRGLFNKDNAEWLNWISQGKALYINKGEIQALIDQQRTNLADVEYLNLDSIAKVVNEFENPKLDEETGSLTLRRLRK